MLMGFFENVNSHWTYKHWERVKIWTFAKITTYLKKCDYNKYTSSVVPEGDLLLA